MGDYAHNRSCPVAAVLAYRLIVVLATAELARVFQRGLSFTHFGIPVVLVQKTTILWKCLYLLASLKDSSGLGATYETKRRSEEENPVHRQNTTVNVDKIRGFRLLYVWVKTFIFLHGLTVY